MEKKICTLSVFLFLAIGYARAQDYMIDFSGSGASSSVTAVKIENLTQGTSKTINGNDVLRLLSVLTGMEEISEDRNYKARFFPNPMVNSTRLHFFLPEAGNTLITIYDLSGREICQTERMLDQGHHFFRIENINEGIWLLKINSGKNSISGRLVSSGSGQGSAKIEFENSTIAQDKKSDSKGLMAEVQMQYNSGDRLKITGQSGNYSTVITDVPAASKTISFNFVACTDRDGNNYSVVVIGSAKGETENIDASGDKGYQIWMAENLETATLNDGTAIQLVNNDAEWGTLTTPAFGWYLNNQALYKEVYGGYYNWYAVNTGKLCPLGWRVPNDADWSTLFSSLGGAGVAGGKLRATGLTYWMSPNTGATNESGFTGLGGGSREPAYGSYSGAKYLGSWWTSTNQAAPGYGFFKELQWDITVVNQAGMVKTYGRNVRCIKE
jgi:uncharacterized protein (TIGR02145 family)